MDERLGKKEGPQACQTTPEQIVAILRRVEQGDSAEDVYCNEQQYGGMKLDEVKELKTLGEENARLQRRVADRALNIQVLKAVNSKFCPAYRLKPPGDRRVHAMVLRRGLSSPRRTVQRVRRCEGPRVLGPARQPRCPSRADAKIKAEGVIDVWCVDLVFDATRHGVMLQFLTTVDGGSRYCIDLAVGRRMTARDLVRALEEAGRRHGKVRPVRPPQLT